MTPTVDELAVLRSVRDKHPFISWALVPGLERAGLLKGKYGPRTANFADLELTELGEIALYLDENP